MIYLKTPRGFLFHTGSIKRISIESLKGNSSVFLFHTGSIKRPYRIYMQYLQATFLFHTGSIKRTQTSFTHSPFPHCFYSILVRLKVYLPGQPRLIDEQFLFHTGSIKSLGRYIYRRRISKFLFHTGSIKRINNCHCKS